MKIEILTPDKIDPTLRKKLRSLTYRSNGTMQYCLTDIFRNEKGSKASVVVVREDDTILGWSLYYRNRAMFYVRVAVRKQGIGKLLATTIQTRLMSSHRRLVVYSASLLSIPNTRYVGIFDDDLWPFCLEPELSDDWFFDKVAGANLEQCLMN